MGIAMRCVITGLCVAAVGLGPRPALAGRKDKPTQIVPQQPNATQRRQARRESVDRSEAGTRRGVLEISLGSVVLATSGLLIGRGIWEPIHARPIIEACEADPGAALECTFNPRLGSRIAMGLSFGFAVVLGVAGGFLLARGIRTHRDYEKWKRTQSQARLQVQPWVTLRQPAAGLSLQARF